MLFKVLNLATRVTGFRPQRNSSRRGSISLQNRTGFEASMHQEQLYEQSIDYFLAPLRPLLDDPQITEILVNGASRVYFEKAGRLQLSPLRFPDELWLESLAQNVAEFVGRKLDPLHHSLSGQLPVGSCAKGGRIHIVAPPTSRSGYCMSIRKFKEDRFTLDELVKREGITEEAAAFLRLAVQLKCNIAISGGTGTGKTTLLNALAAGIPATERVLVIEETSELKLAQPHAVYFEAQQGDSHSREKVTIRDLFVDSLRLRPDRIIVGEVRQGEALDMVQSMLSGHAGALTTVHANSPLDALTRLETLCLMTEEGLPHYVARLQVASAIHLVVQIERRDGRRRVKSIYECRGLNQHDRYRLRPLYRTHFAADPSGIAVPTLRRTGKRPLWAPEAEMLAADESFRSVGWLTKAAVQRVAAAKTAHVSENSQNR